jgi:hypothetical protein
MKGKTAAQLSPVRFISAIGTVLLSYVFSCIYDSTLLYDGRARNVPWATLCSPMLEALCFRHCPKTGCPYLAVLADNGSGLVYARATDRHALSLRSKRECDIVVWRLRALSAKMFAHVCAL